MLIEKNLHEYQRHCVEHALTYPASGLLLDMGLGKSAITLTAITRLKDSGLVKKVLVIAPKRVAEHTWTAEAEKWAHLSGLTFSKILGTATARKGALQAKADIYLINRENVVWLVAQYGGAFPFDMVVIDESSSFKSAKSKRFKALRLVRPKIQRIVLLTGTPVPNGMLDLWPQMYLLDMGERLGKSLTRYREKYFSRGKRNGHIVYEYKLNKGDDDLLGRDIYLEEIYDKIGDVCISMKTEDYLNLPERIDRNVEVVFSPEVQKKYDLFEREQVLALEDVEKISAVNAAALTNKLLQFANGAVYGTDGQWYEVHKEKLEALEEILEAANGQPVLVFYAYRHDKERIKEYFKAYHPRELNTPKDMADWDAREITLLLAHPASAGHGLNLQAGGNIIVWFGLTWSLELYQQANKRLHRQGQTKPTIVHHLIARGTVDGKAALSLANKATGQDALLDAVKALVKKHRNNESI